VGEERVVTSAYRQKDLYP